MSVAVHEHIQALMGMCGSVRQNWCHQEFRSSVGEGGWNAYLCKCYDDCSSSLLCLNIGLIYVLYHLSTPQLNPHMAHYGLNNLRFSQNESKSVTSCWNRLSSHSWIPSSHLNLRYRGIQFRV